MSPVTVDVVLPAVGGSVSVLGLYTLDLPAGAVCDPNAADTQAGYASGAWDSACTAATSDVTVHATVKWSNHRLWVDFSSVRFVPTKTVTLSTDVLASLVRYYGQNGLTTYGFAKKMGLLFASSIDGAPANDAKGDLSLMTYINYTTGRISRRVKHFTGYSIVTGLECEVTPDDPYCVEMDEPPPGRG